MGFRTGAYAKVWEVKPIGDNVTQIRITVSKKQKGGDEYIQDFSGYCSCLGSIVAKKALELHNGDTIKLGDVEVIITNAKKVGDTYVTLPKWEKGCSTYTNYNIYSFEYQNAGKTDPANDPTIVDVQDGGEEGGLPW